MIKRWPGVTGRISMKASRSASSYTMLAGARPATIAQKMQSSEGDRVIGC